MKTVVLQREAVLQRTAEEIGKVLREKPNAVITMAPGRTMQPLWNLLGEKVRNREFSFSEVTFFQTAEFIGVPETYTLRSMTERELLAATDLRKERCVWITEENFKEYDKMIQDAGVLDVAVLGIGDNAHIGLNEPGTQFGTLSRIQKLTEKTKAQYSWLFEDSKTLPERACTMGIQTLTQAKKIMVLALGAEKAKAVFDMLYARNDSVVPAAFLQLPYDVTVYADTEAGEKL